MVAASRLVDLLSGWLTVGLLATGPAIDCDAATPEVSGGNANFAPNDPPGEWRMQARDFASTRYSPLDQVNRDNVKRLRVAWTFSDGAPYGHEGAPLVVGSTMYVVAPFPDVAYALDLSKPGAPIKWTYSPDPAPLAVGKACCDAVIRGWAYADGKLIYNLLDDHTVAVDVQTGKEVWRTKMGNVENGETMTMSPFVVGDKVFVGNSGGELGKIGWLAALMSRRARSCGAPTARGLMNSSRSVRTSSHITRG